MPVLVMRSSLFLITILLLPLASEVGASAGKGDFLSPNCRACHTVNGLISEERKSCRQCHNRDDTLHRQDAESGESALPDGHVVIAVDKVEHEMVMIPEGKFIMGSNDRLPDEGPEHSVHLPDYWIDRYEVTNEQYKRFNDAQQRRSPQHFKNRTYPPGKAKHPVTFVSWHDADAYCRWAGLRLPTEQEWEKAARGIDGRMFPWGNIFEIERANTPQRWANKGGEGDTMPVGSFEKGKSPYGVYDMSGNVWEWVNSWYLPHPGNPQPSESYGERYRILKGGSWWDCSFYRCGISAPVFNRSFFSSKVKNASFGFRCAKDAN